MSTDVPDFSQGAAHVDGVFVPIAEARIPLQDWGFTRSDVTYDVVHVWKGAFFRLQDHLARFERNVEKLRMKLPLTGRELKSVLFQCVRLSGLRDAYVEMICTRGVAPPGSRDPRQCKNSFYAFAIPFVWIARPEKQETGLSLRISSVVRIPPGSVDPTIKNFHWMDMTKGIFEAFDKNDDAALLTNGSGHVIEGPGYNIFAVVGGALVTPSSGMLEGITRRTVIELSRSVGIDVTERMVRADELRNADEIFLTSTAGGVMPVTRIDGVSVRRGTPGTITLDLRSRYWNSHSDPKFSEQIDY